MIGRRGLGGSDLGAVSLGLPHGLNVGPEAGKRGGNLLLTAGQVFVQSFLAGCKTLVEVQGLDLEHKTALDILQAEISSGWMPRFHNIKNVGVGVGGKEGK